MKRRIAVGIIAVTGAVMITAALTAALILVFSGHPSVTACKAAMKAEYARALADGKAGTEPPQCKGIPAKDLTAIAGQVIAGIAPPTSQAESSPSPAESSPSPAGPSFDCTVTRATNDTSGGYPYVAFTVAISSGDADVDVTFVTVVFYDSTGAEVSSDHAQVLQTVTAGQTLIVQLGFEYGQSGMLSSASTCQVTEWS